MDPITLALAGLFAAWAVRRDTVSIRAASVLGVLAGLAPDVDASLLIMGEGTYLLQRGGVTHSLWGAAALASLVAWAVSRRADARFVDLWRCAMAATSSHLVLEALSIQGIAPLAPLSDAVLRLPLVHTVDALVLVGLSLPLWLPALRRRAHRVRGLAGLAGLATALLIAAGVHLAAMSYAADLRDAAELPETAQLHVWPAPWLTNQRSIAVVDSNFAHHAWYDLFSPPDGFVEAVPLNLHDEVVTALTSMPAARRFVDWAALPYAEVRRAPDRAYHVLLADLRYEVPGPGNLAPMIHAIVRRTKKGLVVERAKWRWLIETLEAPGPPPKPTKAKPDKAKPDKAKPDKAKP